MNINFKIKEEKELNENLLQSIKDPSFNKLVNKLQLTKKEAMYLNSKLNKEILEHENCHHCKGLFQCQNSLKGHCFVIQKENQQLYYSYAPCKYTKQIEDQKREKNLENTFYMRARLKDIHTNDKKRLKVIKWIILFAENYQLNENTKGLYLSGSFGSGKTFLISALFNELEYLKGVSTKLVYFPELLRDLKNDWTDYEDKLSYYEKVDLLCIDDIGSEKVSDWSRDEVLGTILQARMNNNKTTFFTSNLTLEELENHFKTKDTSEEILKSGRIMERIKQLSLPLELISENKRI